MDPCPNHKVFFPSGGNEDECDTSAPVAPKAGRKKEGQILIAKISAFTENRARVLLICVMFAAALLRFYGLDWGTDNLTGQFHAFHPDETTIISNSRWVGTDLRKIVAPYGKAPMYILWAVANTVGTLTSTDPFDLTNNTTARFTYTLARSLSALLGLLTVWVVYKIGDRLGGTWVGLLSAFFLAFSAGHIQQSHYYTVEIAFTFWVTLALYLMLSMPGASKRIYIVCGVVCGLAAGTRLAGVWLGVPFIIAHLWEGQGIRNKLKNLATPAVACYLLAAFLVTSICEPFLLLDPAHYFKTDTVLQISSSIRIATGESIHIWTLSDFATTPYLFHLTDLLPFALGLPLEVASLVGLVLLIRRRQKTAILILSWCLFYFLIIGRLHSKPIRYIVPMLPSLAIVGAWATWQSIDWLRKHSRLFYLPALIVIVPAVAWGVGITRIYMEEDSRITASRWVHHNIPPGATVLTERGGYPTTWLVPPDRYNRKVDGASYFIRSAGGILMRGQISNFRRKIEGADWILIIEENRMRQFLTVPFKYPIPYAIYKKLDSGELGFDLVKEFKVNPGIPGWTRSQKNAETTITAFDHPRVMVYKRREDANPEGLLDLWSQELDADPTLPDRHILAGLDHYAGGEWEKSLAAFTKAIDVQNDHILSLASQRMAYLRMNRNSEAEAVWRQLWAMGNSGLISSAVGLSHTGLDEEAAEFLTRFTETITDDHVALVDAYQKLSKLLIRLERPAEDVETLKKLVALDPSRHEAWHLLAHAYVRNHQINEAIDASNKAIQLNPESGTYRTTKMDLATEIMNRGETEKALQLYKQVLSEGRPLENLHYNIGVAHYTLQQPEEAIFHFRASTQLFPDHLRSHRALGYTYMAAGKTLEAVSALTRALQIDPGNTEIRNSLSSLEEKLGR